MERIVKRLLDRLRRSSLAAGILGIYDHARIRFGIFLRRSSLIVVYELAFETTPYEELYEAVEDLEELAIKEEGGELMILRGPRGWKAMLGIPHTILFADESNTWSGLFWDRAAVVGHPHWWSTLEGALRSPIDSREVEAVRAALRAERERGGLTDEDSFRTFCRGRWSKVFEEHRLLSELEWG